MISWKTTYSLDNLKEACECLGTSSSQLDYLDTTKVSLKDINIMWHGISAYEEEKLEFGWGEGLPLPEVVSKLQQTYNRSFISNTNEVDPIILIDGCVFDGWSRCSLAYALGDMTVMAAAFKTNENKKESIYLTNPNNFKIAKENLLSLGAIYEEFNNGLLVFFDSKQSKKQAVKILKDKIDPTDEGNWEF
jgi:hypothetical protein